MIDPGGELARRQQSLLGNKLDKRVLEKETAVWAREQLEKKEDSRAGGAFSHFQAEMTEDEIPEQSGWGTEGPSSQPFARIVNYDTEGGWRAATLMGGGNPSTLVPVDSILTKPSGHLYSTRSCKASNSASAVSRYHEMRDVGPLFGLEKDPRESYSEATFSRDPECDSDSGEKELGVQKELGPGGRPALVRRERDLREIFSKEETPEGGMEEINKHYDLSTREEASPEEASLSRLVAGREPMAIVVLRKTKTLAGASLRLKCRVTLLASQLRTIPGDSPFKLDGGSIPAQLTLTCADVVEIVEVREEVAGDGRSAFPSTKVFRDAESSAPLRRDDKTGEFRRVYLRGRLPSSAPCSSQHVKITGGANGASSNPVFYDSTSDSRLLCGPLVRSSRDGCLFVGTGKSFRHRAR